MSLVSQDQLKNYLYFYYQQKEEQPLGRLFCDDYKISDPDLYRECDNKIAIRIIEERYVTYF